MQNSIHLAIEIKDLQVGAIIKYYLRPEELPVIPEKLWRGKIIRTTFDNPKCLDHVEVESLEPGYEGEREIVYIQQIAAIE